MEFDCRRSKILEITMFVYQQSTGIMTLNGEPFATGYSGKGHGLNNPDRDHVSNVGPIPRGEYRIGEAFHHPSKGPVCMRLIPKGHNALGRTGFLIHGDNSKLDNSASEGCIILARMFRQQIANSKVTQLIVIA